MNLLRSFPPLAFTLVLLSIAGLCAAQESVQLLLVAGTLAAMSWYVTEGPRGRSLPRWVSNVLVIGASLNVFVDLFQNRDDVMGVLGRFAIWLTLIKLYERRTARDHAHLLTLSLLLMMTGCMQSNDLLFGVILLLYAGLGLYVLLLYQMYVSFEQSRNIRQAAIPPDYRLVPPLKPTLGRLAGLRFRAQAATVAAVGVLLSMVVFMAFPRGVGVNMLGTLRPEGADRVAQFSWEIDLNVGGRVNDSRARALSVQVRDMGGRPLRSDEPLLLRGAILDQYHGSGRWRSSERGQRPIHTSAAVATPIGAREAPSGSLIEQRFSRHRAAHGLAPLFSMYMPAAVLTEGSVELLYDPAKQTLRTTEHARRLSEYSVFAIREPDDQALEDLVAEVTFGGRSWFHGDDRRILQELAADILGISGVPRERPVSGDVWAWNRQAASAFMRHLQSSGGFTYTTDLRGLVYHGQSDDPIIQFLTNTKRGHCEFFASGLAALCHSVGIPARVAVGYLAADYDPNQEQYIVLERNAHAWAEVAVGPRRWQTFDATPPAALLAMQSADFSFADTVRDIYQNFEGDWSQTVVGFDDDVQSRLANSLNKSWSSRFASMLDEVRDWMERVNQAFYFGPAGYIWMGIVAFALVIAVIALVKLMRRSLALRRTLRLQHMRGAEYQRMLRQLGFYLDMLWVLKRGGLAKPDWQPPLQFADAVVSRADAGAANLVRRISGLFYASRYGRQKLTREQVEGARRMVEDLAAALRVKR